MAAAQEVHPSQIVDLRGLRVQELDPLLEEEAATWRQLLHWDFSASADLVRRFVQIQALSGFALMSGARCVGYCYYVCEERKGLIGDAYVSPAFRSQESEALLLNAMLKALLDNAYVRRVESQLMVLRPIANRTMPYAAILHTYPRRFMMIALEVARKLAPGTKAREVRYEPWEERRQDEAAHLIADAYYGHIDSEINDQYRSIAGARRFLLNIVQYPGCGKFFKPASFVAYHPETQRLCGVALASTVANDVGHVTQICVSPEMQGKGVGYELLRLVLTTLGDHGYREASLTVTNTNVGAIHLYERMGFQTRTEFNAFVWEKS